MTDQIAESAPLLACPADHAALVADGDVLACPQCARRYPRDGNFADFLDKADDFYEGRYLNAVKINPKPGFFSELPLWLLIHGYVWAARHYIPAGGTVVELGCAGGVRWFGSRFKMVGLDLSRAGLVAASSYYAMTLRGNALSMPLADGSVDAVVSSCFFEHIAPEDKPVLLAECWRVLKPGGRLVFLYDIATQNPLISHYRSADPARYQQWFLDIDGHIGYQSLPENDEIFRKLGYHLLKSRSLERSPLQNGSVWHKFGDWPGWRGKAARGMARLTGGHMDKPVIALLRIIDETIGLVMPSSWGRIAITVAEKPR